MDTRPVSSAKNGAGFSPKPKSTEAYVADKFVTPRLSSPLLGVLTNVGTYYVQNSLDPTSVERSFIELEELHPTPEQLQILEEAINYFTGELGGGVDSVLADYIKLLKANPTPEQLNLLARAVKASSIEMYEIIGAFTSLIETKPHPHLWTIFDNAVTHKAFTNVDKLSSSFAKLSGANLSYNQIELLSSVVSRNIHLERDVADLCESFADFFSAKPSDELLEIFEDIAKYYEESGWKMEGLFSEYAELAKRNPSTQALEVLKDINEISKTLNISLEDSTKHFTNSLTGGLVPPNILATIALEAVGSKRYEAELSTKVSRLISKGYKNLPPEKLKALRYMIAYKEMTESRRFFINYPILITDEFEAFEAGQLPDEIRVQIDFGHLVKTDSPVLVLFDTYDKVIRFHSQKNEYQRKEQIKNCFGMILGLDPRNLSQKYIEPAIQLFRNYGQALTFGHIETPEESQRIASEIAAHTAIAAITRSDNPGIVKSAKSIIQVITYGDSLPFPLKDSFGNPNPEAKRAYEETLQVYARAYNFHHGFGALTFDAKRPPGKDPSMLARFGKDVARKVHYINARDFNSFPGKGFLIEGLIPEKIFVQDTNAKDPLWKYKSAWEWAKYELDDLPKTRFIFTRGMIALTCFNDDRYVLKDINGKKVHFSYVVFNDHFHNYKSDVAFLVPTEVLNKKLENATIPYEDFTGFMPSKNDVNEVGFTYDDLYKAAKEIPANIINLGWSSNFNGGLCNAYLPDSLPYHEWERKLRKQHTKDSTGHIHKSHITGGFVASFSNRKTDQLLQPLRLAHFSVYTVTNRYQNLLDLFRISLALWHKGQTIGEPLEIPDISDDDLFEGEDFVQRLSEGTARGANSIRMLIEAYRWNSARKEGTSDKKDFPILVLADTLDYWSRPASPFMIDSYDLVLTTKGNVLTLPPNSNGQDTEEVAIWNHFIMPHLISSSKDLRFYDRRALGVN